MTLRRFEARYYDSRTARAQPVMVTVLAEGLRFVAVGGPTRTWPWERVRQVQGRYQGEPVWLARGPKRLEALVFEERAVLDAIRQTVDVRVALLRPLSPWWLGTQAIAAMGILVLAVWWMQVNVVPRLAIAAVDHVPVQFDKYTRRLVERAYRRTLATGRKDREAALMRIVARLATGGPPTPFHYRVFVLTLRKDPNACALPGGLIMVNQGMLDEVENAEQLASVLAHEMTHVERRHYVRRQLESLIASPLVAVLAAGQVGPDALLASAIELGASHHSREHELEADELGMQRMIQAHIDPQAMVEEWAKSERFRPSVWDSHPSQELRLNRMRAIADRASGPYARIDVGMPWAELVGTHPKTEVKDLEP